MGVLLPDGGAGVSAGVVLLLVEPGFVPLGGVTPPAGCPGAEFAAGKPWLLGAAGGTAEAGKLEAAGLAGAVGCDGCV